MTTSPTPVDGINGGVTTEVAAAVLSVQQPQRLERLRVSRRQLGFELPFVFGALRVQSRAQCLLLSFSVFTHTEVGRVYPGGAGAAQTKGRRAAATTGCDENIVWRAGMTI